MGESGVMVYKLGLSAEKGWRKLPGFRRLVDAINDVKFIDGVDEETFKRKRNAA
jgi:putative transposase